MKSISFHNNLIKVQEDLLSFAYKLTTNYEEANDLLQETSLKALDNKEKYAADTNFKGWIFTIMRNIFINNYRNVVRDQAYLDTYSSFYHIQLPEDAYYDHIEKAFELKEICQAVHALPTEYRIPFAMYASGFKYKEIAKRMNLSVGTVKSRIFYTRLKLQEVLKDFR